VLYERISINKRTNENVRSMSRQAKKTFNGQSFSRYHPTTGPCKKLISIFEAQFIPVLPQLPCKLLEASPTDNIPLNLKKAILLYYTACEPSMQFDMAQSIPQPKAPEEVFPEEVSYNLKRFNLQPNLSQTADISVSYILYTGLGCHFWKAGVST